MKSQPYFEFPCSFWAATFVHTLFFASKKPWVPMAPYSIRLNWQDQTLWVLNQPLYL